MKNTNETWETCVSVFWLVVILILAGAMIRALFRRLWGEVQHTTKSEIGPKVRFINVKHIMVELSNLKIRRGKHAGVSFSEAYEKHPDYVYWGATHQNLLGNQLHAFVEYCKLRNSKDD